MAVTVNVAGGGYEQPGKPDFATFVPPRQWASMRRAEALERETGKRVIHFEKGDFQGG